MPHQYARLLLRDQTTRRKPALDRSDEQDLVTKQSNIVGLQRFVGNRGMQNLLSQGRVSQIGARTSLTPAAAPSVQRCSCGGTCAACKVDTEDELSITSGVSNEVQRWWDDEETESEDSGGSWLDDVTDWVSDTASDAYDWATGGGGTHESESESDGTESEESGGGSWLDDAYDWASDTAKEIYDWAEETVGGWFDEGESDDSGWSDWQPWEEEESGESENTEGAHDIPSVNAVCESDEGVGFGGGSGRTISLHGRTDANYDHGLPKPDTFPQDFTVNRYELKGGQKVFDVSGTLNVTYTANPSITLPTVPSGLTPCQEKAVKDFIDGPLTAHENDHKSAFETNYNGSASFTISHKRIADTPDNEKNALHNPINAEDVKRVDKANKASNKLDPWNKEIPGLDCVEPSEEGEESESE